MGPDAKKLSNKEKGRLGEDLAASEYVKRGFVIEERNWRKGRTGEIDVIALHREKRILCFCEVKTRKDRSFADAGAAVDYKKRMRIRKLAELFLLERPEFSNFYVRFDVAEVYFCGTSETCGDREACGTGMKIDIIEGAF